MREYKYKAYIKAENRIFNVDVIDFNGQKIYEYIYSDEGIIGTEIYSFNDVKLMQDTGFKSYELFEGYIVEDMLQRTFQIIFNEKIIRWHLLPINQKALEFYSQYGCRGVEITSWLLDDNRPLKVLGNIYQNPELIKEKEVSHG